MELKELGETAIKLAKGLGAEEIEAYLRSGRELLARLENNQLKLAKSQTRDGIGIRVFKQHGLGFASTNQLDMKSVEEAVAGAVRLAGSAPFDPHNELPDPVEAPRIAGLYDPAAEEFNISQVIEYANRMLQAAKDYDARVAVDRGEFNLTLGRELVMSSRGMNLEERGSLFSCFIMGMARADEEVSCFQYEFDATRQASKLKMEELGRALAQKVIATLGARKGKSFKGSVILDPDVVADLILSVIGFAVNADNVQRGWSRFQGKLGSTVASPTLMIEDDGTLPGGVDSASFDREGLPHKKLKILDRGVLASYLYNAYTAHKEGRSSTGHAIGGPRGIPRIGPTNLIVASGDKGREELIWDLTKGLLVTRFSGFPNPVSGDFSGVVKGGFLIDGGEVKYPVIETMIAGNVFELLHRISQVSRERKQIGPYLLPWVQIEDVSVTSG